MSDMKILDPVAEVPPITRDTGLRPSKWDEVLERAEAIKSRKSNAVPIEFESYNSATSAARRIRERAEKVGRGEDFEVEQRGNTVYVHCV